MTDTLSVAALLGAATGIRSTSGLAILASTPSRPQNSWLRDEWVRRALGIAFVGETLADKVAALPARTQPLVWAGRVALGGAAAAVAAAWTGSSRVQSAVVGGVLAAATAWAATRLRGAAEERGAPDLAPALGEDVAIFALGAAAERLLRERVDFVA